MKEQTLPEKQDSIEILRSAKGTYTWKIKRYFEFKNNVDASVVIQEIKDSDKRLRKEFLFVEG